eukprot:UN19997
MIFNGFYGAQRGIMIGLGLQKQMSIIMCVILFMCLPVWFILAYYELLTLKLMYQTMTLSYYR